MTFVEVARPGGAAWADDHAQLGKIPDGDLSRSMMLAFTPETLDDIELTGRIGTADDPGDVGSWWLYRIGHGLVADGGEIEGGPSAVWSPPAEAFVPGAYRLAFSRDENEPDAPTDDNYIGGNYFTVTPEKTGMPPLPPSGTYDIGLAATTLTLPKRLDFVNPDNVAAKFADFQYALDILLDHYVDHDPAKPKPIVGNFSFNDTGRAAMVAGNLSTTQRAQITAAAAEFPQVTHWACMNEPDNFGFTGAQWAAVQEAHYNAVKAGNPAALVLGPELLHVGGRATKWLRDFLDAGGGQWVDAWSFHTYPGHQGSSRVGRRTLQHLVDVLSEYPGQAEKPRFNTEACDFYSADNGGGTAPVQAQKIMLDLRLCAQFGIPAAHWYLFYWEEHGFDEHPAWLSNRGGGKLPGYGALVVEAQQLLDCAPLPEIPVLNFGPVAGEYVLGSLYRRANGTAVVAFQGDGAHVPMQWVITGAEPASIDWADHEGNVHEADVDDVDGQLVATVDAAPMPRYLHLPAGATATPRPRTYGTRRVPVAWSITGGIPGPRGPEIWAGTDENAFFWDRPNERNAFSVPVGSQWPTPEDPVDVELYYASAAPIDLLVLEGVPGWRLLTTIRQADVYARVGGSWELVASIDNDDVTVLRVASTKDDGLNSWWEVLDYRDHTFEVDLDRVDADAVRVRVYSVTPGAAPEDDAVTAYGQLDSDDDPVYAVGTTAGGVSLLHLAAFDTESAPAPAPGEPTRYVVRELP